MNVGVFLWKKLMFSRLCSISSEGRFRDSLVIRGLSYLLLSLGLGWFEELGTAVNMFLLTISSLVSLLHADSPPISFEIKGVFELSASRTNIGSSSKIMWITRWKSLLI